jgi:hypothetical protein
MFDNCSFLVFGKVDLSMGLQSVICDLAVETSGEERLKKLNSLIYKYYFNINSSNNFKKTVPFHFRSCLTLTPPPPPLRIIPSLSR